MQQEFTLSSMPQVLLQKRKQFKKPHMHLYIYAQENPKVLKDQVKKICVHQIWSSGISYDSPRRNQST